MDVSIAEKNEAIQLITRIYNYNSPQLDKSTIVLQYIHSEKDSLPEQETISISISKVPPKFIPIKVFNFHVSLKVVLYLYEQGLIINFKRLDKSNELEEASPPPEGHILVGMLKPENYRNINVKTYFTGTDYKDEFDNKDNILYMGLFPVIVDIGRIEQFLGQYNSADKQGLVHLSNRLSLKEKVLYEGINKVTTFKSINSGRYIFFKILVESYQFPFGKWISNQEIQTIFKENNVKGRLHDFQTKLNSFQLKRTKYRIATLSNQFRLVLK